MGKDTHAVTREGPGCTRETPGEEVTTRVLQLECSEKRPTRLALAKNYVLPAGKDTCAVTRDGPGCTRVTPREEVTTRVLQLECENYQKL